jgi:two-component system sensor histidine kinase KdpD
MSDSTVEGRGAVREPDRASGPQEDRSELSPQLPLAAQYGVSLLFVALATGLAFIVENLISAPNLTLIFVLPVMAAATFFGWGPSLAAVVAGVLAFDFFFTAPYFSFRIASPSDLWAAALLLVIAAAVSTLAAEARSRALQAHRAAEQAQALQALAHVIIQARPQSEIVEAAATAVNRIFRAPSVIFMQKSGAFRAVASAGGARITSSEEDAAKGVLETRLPARAETYPFEQSQFDFWPVVTSKDFSCVIGVDFTRSERERPAAPVRFIEIVGAYLATAFGGSRKPADATAS